MVKYYIVSLITLLFLLSSCEKDTKLSLAKGKTQLAVDAYLTNQKSEQLIKLRLTGGYLENTELLAVNGAIVKLSIPDSIMQLFKNILPPHLLYLTQPLDFVEVGNTGNYKYTLPAGFDTLPIFRLLPYELSITYDGETFKSVAFKDNVPNIDSLTYVYRKQQIQGSDTAKAGYIISDMNCVDLKGPGNCYWIKSYRNGVFFNKPSEMNLSYDGAFGPGSDGLNFIAPLAFNITPNPERLQLKDTLLVECHSIGVASYAFLSLAQGQMTNTGLFATPPVNVFTNLENVNKSSKAKAVGFFTLATVSTKQIIIKYPSGGKATL